MRIEAIDLNFVELPLKSPFQTSFGVEEVKSAWIVEVKSGGISGYAESVASRDPLYSEETHATVYFAWKNHLVPRLMSLDIDGPEKISEVFEPLHGNRMAKAALEMAIWDWFAKSQGQPLWALLGGSGERQQIPVGVSIGIQPSLAALLDLAEGYFKKRYRRLKVKIKPGFDYHPLSTLRRAFGMDMPIMADANSAYRLADIDALKRLDELELMMLEQPLAYDDIIDHRTLSSAIQTPICLDESIRSEQDARQALGIGACRIINIKVGRVGGYQVARRIHDTAARQGAPVWCGGMLETGIGRAHNLHLSTLSNFSLPGDTSASDRYFDEDLIDPPFKLNRDGTLTVPSGPGIGVAPDPGQMQKFCSHRETWRLQGQWHLGGIPVGDPTSF